MQSPDKIAEMIADRVAPLPMQRGRRLIAIAGPPASGKSTVSAALLTTLRARGIATGLFAMDGYHLDNRILDARGLRARKGAPETFDFGGFAATLRRLLVEEEVIAATFDRSRDVSVGSSEVISPEMKTVIVEGNYLLLDEAPWNELLTLWDFSAMISADQDVLEDRLIERWLSYGFAPEAARAKALENDIPNAKRVVSNSATADLLITSNGAYL